MKNPVKKNTALSAFWMTYFIFSIAWVGGLLGYGVVIPLHLCSFLISSLFPGKKLQLFAQRVHCFADQLLRTAIGFLMKIQPWYSVELDLKTFKEHEKKGCLIVSNHRSTLDAFMLLSTVNGIRIFAKRSLFYVPFLGVMMWVTRQIPAKRGDLKSLQSGLNEMRRKVLAGEHVHVFPEMTRCAEGFEGVQSFSLAPFQIAFQDQLPIVPVVFQHTDQVWPKGSFRLRSGVSTTMRSLPMVHPQNFSNVVELRDAVRKMILNAL